LNEADRNERIREVVDRLLGRSSQNALRFGSPGLDATRPNIHDSKAEFQVELATVQRAIENLREVLAALVGPVGEDDPRYNAMLGRLRSAIDQSAGRRVAGLKPESTVDLIRKNKVDTGFFYNSLLGLFDLLSAFNDRLDELKSQEKQFWTVTHRPANYYARTIALRLARLYAKEKGKRPTFGTARDGGHPSTDFGRALEQVFSILGVRANVRGAATWAIEQLTEDDLKPPQMGALFRMTPAQSAPTVPDEPTTNAVRLIAKILAERQGQ
jgi:hypothetical protein